MVVKTNRAQVANNITTISIIINSDIISMTIYSMHVEEVIVKD